MSKYFNTSADHIPIEEMQRVASFILNKPPAELSARECMAAVPAAQAIRDGVPIQNVRKLYFHELRSMIQ